MTSVDSPTTEAPVDREQEIAEFKIAADAAMVEARRIGSSAPIWALIDRVARDRTVDFGDVARAIATAREIEKGSAS